MTSDERNRIKLLPDELINRIAAGEVVERPATVLKELVENSLDAGADRIDIEVEGGGKKLIRVTDNGRGMGEEDLFMCLERHATSKLDREADLTRIATLGFRGEALPSIGSVSRLSITSAVEGGEGHVVTVEGGRLKGLAPAPANRGTTVEVADLFRYVPARRKFLKSDHTESVHLLEVAQCYALSRPGLSLNFRDNGREVLSVEARHDFQTRVYRVLGRAAAESLTPFAYKAGERPALFPAETDEADGSRESLSITGWLGAPEQSLRSTANLFVYVLGRPVRDRLLNRALADGYGRLLPPGRWPTAIIFIDIDPEEVDVNVHPAKAEVRFRRPGAVFSALSAAVSRAAGPTAPPTAGSADELTPLASAPAPPPPPPLFREAPRPAAGEEARFDRDSAASCGPGRPPRPARPIRDTEPDGPDDSSVPPWMIPEAARPSIPDELGIQAGAEPEFPEPPVPGTPSHLRPEEEEIRAAADVAGAAPRPAAPPAGLEELRPLAQLYNSYILAEGARGLYIIDQHAAHERILYNQLKEKLVQGLPGQSLLFPDSLDLPPRQALAAEKLGPHLAHLGFDLRHFGDRTFILHGAPAILGGRDPWPPLLEMLGAAQGRLESLEGAGMLEALRTMANSWFYSLACRAAIKAGDKMTPEAMTRLIADMAATPNGAYCPHGRPAIWLIDRGHLEKRFDRR